MSKTVINAILKLVNLVALLIAVAWLSRSPGWEPLVTSLVCLASLIALEVTGSRETGAKERRDSPDCRLFEAFLETLPSGGSVKFIDDHDMGGSFDLRRLDDLYGFANEWKDAEHEFQDKRLEKKRKELLDLVDRYLLSIARNTFPTPSGPQSVPREWEMEQYERFVQAVGELHNLADQIVVAHQDLVRTARKRLNV